MDMNRTLHDTNNAQRILKLTADTMLLVDKNGVCIDIDPHCDLWFLQDEILLGKNIFELLPEYTRERVVPVFQSVLEGKKSVSKNFKLVLKENVYYFKCIMHPYDDMVLCQYRDITQRSNVKRQLEQANRTLREIQKVAQIGQWVYNTNENVFHYLGHTGVLCEETVRSISFEKYREYIVEEDRQTFINWKLRNLERFNTDSISYRVQVNGEIYYMRIQAYLREELPDGSLTIEGYIQNITDIQRRRNDINTLTHAINNAKVYNTNENVFHYLGHTGVLCEETVRSISFEKYREYIVEEDRQTFINWKLRNLERFNTDSISYRVQVNGEIYYMRIQAYLREELPDGSLTIEGYIQNITDIQRRRNDINTLTHAINNAKESIFAAREDGTIIFANRRFLHNHGICENVDICKLKIYDIAADMPTQKAWNERCKDIMHGGSSNFIAHHPSKINRDILAYEGTMYNVTNDSGEESYWSFAHDISERIRYEAQIKRLNLIMDTTINNLPAGIVVKEINNDFRYLYRNRESYNRDLCVGESIGKNDFDYYPPIVADKKRQEDIQVATTGKGLHWTTEGRDKNGNRIILDKRKIRVDGDELSSPIIVSIEWDITELEMIKRELQSSKEKAEMSDKLKSAFLANMSHEIRTPLNAIVGFSQLIAESNDEEERKTYYGIVESNNGRLLDLINEILDLSKIESGIIEFTIGPTSLHNLCREVHDAHIFRMPVGVSLVHEPSDESLMIETDKNRVFQVISNLIGNAAKFTKEGSISYGYKRVGDQIVFHVTDTGTGIEPEKVGRVFERFAKLNNHAQGTGLGLSICKSIVERLGGKITVNSEFGVGTTFNFTLPYNIIKKVADTTEGMQSSLSSQSSQLSQSSQPSDLTEQPSNETPQEQIPEKQACILIAEDTDSNYDLLNAILGKNYRLVHAHDGMEAVIMYDEVKPDLILIDIKMPNLDGLEATKIIRELSATVPIVVQSAYAYPQDQKAAKEAGCSDFISKPIVQSELKKMLNKWLSPELNNKIQE